MTLDDLRPEVRRRFGRLRNRWVFLVQIGVAVLVGLGVGAWFYLTRNRESTDDAQVDAHVTPVAARVSGTVLSVPVADNQTVEAGTVLARADAAAS